MKLKVGRLGGCLASVWSDAPSLEFDGTDSEDGDQKKSVSDTQSKTTTTGSPFNTPTPKKRKVVALESGGGGDARTMVRSVKRARLDCEDKIACLGGPVRMCKLTSASVGVMTKKMATSRDCMAWLVSSPFFPRRW